MFGDINMVKYLLIMGLADKKGEGVIYDTCLSDGLEPIIINGKKVSVFNWYINLVKQIKKRLAVLQNADTQVYYDAVRYIAGGYKSGKKNTEIFSKLDIAIQNYFSENGNSWTIPE